MAHIQRSGFILLALSCLGPGASLEAQSPKDSQWIPPASSVGVGSHRFVGDGESSNRAGVSWYWSRNRRLLITSRFWDHYDVVETELRWLRASRSSIRPMVTISGIWQEYGIQQSFGGTVGGGLEYYTCQILWGRCLQRRQL